jgi:hypothetical protein
LSIIKHVTLQKIVAHDFRYDPRRILFCRLCMFDEENAWRKSCSVSTPRDGTRGLIHAMCHSPVLVSHIFLEIQVKEE